MTMKQCDFKVLNVNQGPTLDENNKYKIVSCHKPNNLTTNVSSNNIWIDNATFVLSQIDLTKLRLDVNTNRNIMVCKQVYDNLSQEFKRVEIEQKFGSYYFDVFDTVTVFSTGYSNIIWKYEPETIGKVSFCCNEKV